MCAADHAIGEHSNGPVWINAAGNQKRFTIRERLDTDVVFSSELRSYHGYVVFNADETFWPDQTCLVTPVRPVVGLKALLRLPELESGKTTLRPERSPAFILSRYSPQLSAAWPRSMMAYLAEFWDNSAPHGATMFLTLFHRGRSVRSLSRWPTSSPALNSPGGQWYANRASPAC